jgi:hypothetical protein
MNDIRIEPESNGNILVSPDYVAPIVDYKALYFELARLVTGAAIQLDGNEAVPQSDYMKRAIQMVENTASATLLKKVDEN